MLTGTLIWLGQAGSDCSASCRARGQPTPSPRRSPHRHGGASARRRGRAGERPARQLTAARAPAHTHRRGPRDRRRQGRAPRPRLPRARRGPLRVGVRHRHGAHCHGLRRARARGLAPLDGRRHRLPDRGADAAPALRKRARPPPLAAPRSCSRRRSWSSRPWRRSRCPRCGGSRADALLIARCRSRVVPTIAREGAPARPRGRMRTRNSSAYAAPSATRRW